MTMYHLIKFGCKKISISVDMVNSHIWSYDPLTVTLTLKTVNQSFCMTLSGQWWCITIPSLVTNSSAFEKIPSPDEHSSTFLISAVTLTLNTTTQSYLFKRQSNFLPSNQLSLQKDQHFRRHTESNNLTIQSLNCDLDLEDSKPVFSQDTPAHDDASLYQVW